MPVGMETDIQIKASNGQVSVDKAQGIVECFVAGIGNKDSVGDIIQPGAFAGTLQRRKPRVVWGHNWNDPIGKVLDIQEVGPSDPRLPEKMKAGGVGGLYARVQFNLGSEKGREAFANVAFFGGEQEWSIGYKTINATFDPVRQANILHEVELYECSPVLHGANQLTGTISVKGAEAALMERPITETHDLEFAFDDLDEKDGMLAMMPVETPRTESMSDEHDHKLELELQSRSPQPIKLISATEGVAVFQVQRSDNGTAMYRVHFHHCPKRGFMLGQPERVIPQMVYAPVKPPGVQVKPQINPANRYEQNPQDTVMPRIMRIVQKLDSDDSAKGEDQLVISCKLEDAFATKSLLDPIIDYHGAIAEVTEEGIIIKSGATPDFIEAVETATKALGRRLGRGLSRGGGGGSGKVRRAGRALTTRFNPDARDADLDMLVQEGTPWERPALPRKPGPSRGFRSSRRLLQGRNWDEEGDETDLDTPTPDARPEGVGAEERPPTKERMGQFTRDEYEAFRNEQIQKIIKAYGIQDVSDPIYPHPALTDFYNFDHTELVPIEFFDDMPGNIGPSASNGWDEDAATRAGEMRSYELDAPIIMGKLDELTEDIRANGIKHSLVVQYDPETGTLALDEGNHRLAAAQRLGMQVVPVRMIRQPSAKRRDIRGPKKEIPTRANSRGDLINANGELLGPSFKPSDIGVDTQSIAPETRRMRMLVAARGGSAAQGHRRRARQGLESTRNRFDFRATAVSPEREGGQRIERGSLRTPQLARDQTVVWNRATEAGLASRRAAELRSRGFNEAEVTSLMDPPPLRQSGLASKRNFHSENSYGNLQNLIDAREQMLNFLQENPHFDETLLNDYDPDTRSYPGIENFPGGHEEWDDLFSTWEELKKEYDDVLDFFREENDYYHAAEDRRNEVSSELEDHRRYLDSHITEIEENFAPSHMPDGSYLDEDKILEFLKNNDYEGFRALFTPEYILERNDDRRNDRGGHFEDLAVDETRGKPGWETSLEYEWNSAIDVLKDIEEAEQNVYGAEMDVQQHAPNGADIVLEAAEKIDKFDRNMRIEVKPDDSLVSYADRIGSTQLLNLRIARLRTDDEYRRATGLALGDDLESTRIDATTGSLQDFKPKGTGFRSQRGAGLGEDFQLDTSASTAINAAHYNAGDEELAVTFKGGRTYIYGGIASDIAAVVDAESSLGAAINEWVKGRESYLIKPDGTVVDRMGLPTELPTLGEKLKRHANRLRDHRGLDRYESETFKKAQKILDGTNTSPAKPIDRSDLVKQLNSLADNIWRDEEPHVAGLLRDAAAAIRSDPGRRVNAHHSGRMEVSLSEGEIGEISDGLKSTRAKYDGHPDIELGLSAYDKKLQDSKGGKVSLDSAEYNQILESYARLEAVDPDGYFKPGRDVLEMAAFSKKGKWVSPNLAKDSQFPDRDHGFASRRPNNGAPADITPRLQGDLIYWARQQGGFHVVQDLVRRYDRGGEQLSPRDWIRLHDYYANYSPAGRGMPQYGEGRGLRSSRGTPEKSPGGLKKPNEPTGMGPGQARFVGRKWDEVKPENWDELSINEQVDELMINFNPRSDPNKPQVFDWPPPEERLRSVDYDRILGGLLEEIQTREERANPALAMSRRRRERRQRLADAAKNKPAIQRRTRRPQEDTVLSSATGERNTDAFQPGIGGSQREQLLDPEGGQNIEDDVGRQSSSPDAQVALDRRLRIMDALDINIGIKRNALATAVMDDRADESHVEFWDSLQDTLDGDEDLTFDVIERLGVQIDDYLEDQTARTLTADEDRSMTFAGRLREQVVTLREQYEDDRFIKRGDPFIEDVEDTARRWLGTDAAPEGDDDPDDPGGTARVSREDERFGPKPAERPPTGMGVSREAALAVRTGMEKYRKGRAIDRSIERNLDERFGLSSRRGESENREEIESLGEAFRSRRGDRETRRVARESRQSAREMEKNKKWRAKREEKRRQQKAKDDQKFEERVAARRALSQEEQLQIREDEDDVMGQMNPVRTPWGFSSRRDEGRFADDVEGFVRRGVPGPDSPDEDVIAWMRQTLTASEVRSLGMPDPILRSFDRAMNKVRRAFGINDREDLGPGHENVPKGGGLWDQEEGYERLLRVVDLAAQEFTDQGPRFPDYGSTVGGPGGLSSRRTPAHDVAREEGVSLEEAGRIVSIALEGMDEGVLRETLGELAEFDEGRLLNPGHYANAPDTGTGETWPPMNRHGSYDLMGGANYDGPEEFVGTLSEAIDQWMEHRRGGPSGARTPLWADGLEPDDAVIWSYASDDVDGDGIPLLTRSDVEAAFEAGGIPSDGDLDEIRHGEHIERGPQDRRPAGEIMREAHTQGPTSEPGYSASWMEPVDLDALEGEVQNARAHYRAMVEEPEQDPASVEDQLGIEGAIESLHRTRPHELSDMSADELNGLLPALAANPDEGLSGVQARSIQQELAIRDIIDNLLGRLDSANETHLHPGTLRELEAWGFGENNVGRLALVGDDEEQFNEAAVLFHALSRLAEDGRLDGIGGIYSQDDGTITVGKPGVNEREGYVTPNLETQVVHFGNKLHRALGHPPGLTAGSQEATVAKMAGGRYLNEGHLRKILEAPTYPPHPTRSDIAVSPDFWKNEAWQQMAFLELARREARDFDLSIPMEQRSQFQRSLRERARLEPEPLPKEALVALAMRRLRLAEEDRDSARLGQQFGDGLVGAVSDRHYLDDVEGRPRSESPAPRFTPGEPLSEEDIESVLGGPLLRRPDEELHARAMETPEERSAGRLTAQEEADQRVDELIASVEADMEAAETAFRGNRTEEVEGSDNEPAAFEPRPGARRGDAFMSRRGTESDGFRSHRDMSKQRAARNTKDRSTFKQSSPFFKIVYDSLDGEIKQERDSVKRRALEKLKKSFEYFNSSSIRYGPKNPHQSPAGEVQIDNNAIPDIVDALFDVLDRLTKKSKTTELERTKALIDYLEVVDQSSGRTHPEVESMTPIRIAALNKFLEKLLDNGTSDWQ